MDIIEEKDGFAVGDRVRLIGCKDFKVFRIKNIYESGEFPFQMECGSTYNSLDLIKVSLPKEQKRPQFIDIFMDLAINLAERSTCCRRQVGCVVTSEDFSEVYGIGYNGNEQGGANECDSDEPGKCGCLHAEDNALLKTNKGKHIPKIMFVTTVPCKTCAKRIINKGGFLRVYYKEDYRCLAGKELLMSRGIEVIKWN